MNTVFVIKQTHKVEATDHIAEAVTEDESEELNDQLTPITGVSPNSDGFVTQVCMTIMTQLKEPNLSVFGSWGAHNFTKAQSDDDRHLPCLRFMVQGHKFRGWIHIFYVLGKDLYRIEFVSIRKNLKKVYNDVYFDNMQELIDDYVEKIPEYKY